MRESANRPPGAGAVPHFVSELQRSGRHHYVVVVEQGAAMASCDGGTVTRWRPGRSCRAGGTTGTTGIR